MCISDDVLKFWISLAFLGLVVLNLWRGGGWGVKKPSPKKMNEHVSCCFPLQGSLVIRRADKRKAGTARCEPRHEGSWLCLGAREVSDLGPDVWWML